MQEPKEENPPEDDLEEELKPEYIAEEENKTGCIHHSRVLVYKFIESSPVIIVMMIVTVWVLISDDVRQLVADSQTDDIFYTITVVCFCLFVIEILLSFYSKRDYRWSFFFILDVLSTITLLLDVGWISDEIFGTYGTTNTRSAASFAKAARASRLGTRAGRIVRIIRLVRLIRIVKLYKGSNQAQVKREEKESGIKIKAASDVKRKSLHAVTNPVNKSVAIRPIKVSAGHSNPPSVIPSKAKHLSFNLKNELGYDTPRNSVRSNNASLKQGGSQANIQNLYSPAGSARKESGAQDHNASRSNADVDAALAGKTPAGNANSVPQSAVEIEQEGPTLTELEEIEQETMFKETNIGRKLSDLTTKRVICIILGILIGVPIFAIDTYWPDFTTDQSGVQSLLHLFNRNPDLNTNTYFTRSWKTYVTRHYKNPDSPILKIGLIQKNSSSPDNTNDLTDEILKITDTGKYLDLDDSIGNKLRNYEKKTILEPEGVDNLGEGMYSIIATFDMSAEFDLNSYLGIFRTIFVCLVLSISAILFSKDANEIVLQPIENMLNKVKRISKNPLKAARIEEENAVFWDDYYAKKDRRGSKDNGKKRDSKEGINAAKRNSKDSGEKSPTKDEKRMSTEEKTINEMQKGPKPTELKQHANYETTILEKTIVKIGALLALGFGEAGAEIVAKNMQRGGDVDPMIPGKKIVAIFGFCDIRNFTDATEILQEGVMVFVNEIAEVVHSQVDFFSGASNKNIGDAFLLVWKFDDEDVEQDTYTGVLVPKQNSIKVKALAEMAVSSFISIQPALAKAAKLKKYRGNKELLTRMNETEYRVKMGFGLHVGWAIEGAIGSKYKIDASYLSPNVNTSSRLEAATKQFGVWILISDKVRELCREYMRGLMRQVDCVKVKGSDVGLGIFTIDLEVPEAFYMVEEEEEAAVVGLEKKRKRMVERKTRDKLRIDLFSGKKSIKEILEGKEYNLKVMRKPFTAEFYKEWHYGVTAYLRGEWPRAKDKLTLTLNLLKDRSPDKPSRVLLDYMAGYNFKAPDSWNGIRNLTEK